MREQWQLHCTSQWGWQTPLCTMWLLHSKWLSKQNNESASNFVLSLNITLQKLFGWFTSLQLWATGGWQLHHHNMPAHASCLMQSFLAKHQITQVTQPHYSPDLVPCDFWLFPKLKSSLKGNDFRLSMRFRKTRWGSWWWLGELCEVPRCLL